MINFPDAPTNNQVFTAGGCTFVWDTVKWKPLTSVSAYAVIGDTPPASPQTGSFWWDSVGAQLYIYFNDGSSTQWVPVDNQPGPTNTVGVTNGSNAPAGSIGEYLSVVVLTGSAVNMLTGAWTAVATLALTAGDWDVYGESAYSLAGGAAPALLGCAVGPTANTATPPADNQAIQSVSASGVNLAGATYMSTGRARFSLSAPANAYLNLVATFTSGTCAGYGKISARRVR